MTDYREPLPNDRLSRAVDTMRSLNVSDMPSDLLASTELAIEQAFRRRKLPFVFHNTAAAAIVGLVALAVGLVLFDLTPSSRLADMAKQVSTTKTMRATLSDPGGKGHLIVSGPRRRFQRDDGAIILVDSATSRQLLLDTKQKVATRSSLWDITPVLDFYGFFRTLDGTSTPIDDYVDGSGQHFRGVFAETSLRFNDDVSLKAEIKIWKHSKSGLPVRVEIEIPEAGEAGRIVLENIEWDIALDEALFEMTIPEGYSTMGVFPDQLGPAIAASEASKLTIVPGVGIGDAKFGMSREEVIAAIGKPEFQIGEVHLCYPSKGLQLVLVGREPDKLGMIIANPMDAANLSRNEFPGQTDKGVRIGSSAEDVIAAYGEPDPLQPGEKAPSERVGVAGYSRLGLGFHFNNGKVQQIFVSRID